MSDKHIEIPELEGQLTLHEAAELLGITYSTAQRHVQSGNLQATRKGHMYFVTHEAVANFKPKIAGRPRASVPKWHFPAQKNELIVTTIEAKLGVGITMADCQRALARIKPGDDYAFPGTIARYIWFDRSAPERVQFFFVWRETVMPEEAEIEEMLTALRTTLGGTLDWATARYGTGQVLMHA
jgi:excisionase family DNA binding protein